MKTFFLIWGHWYQGGEHRFSAATGGGLLLVALVLTMLAGCGLPVSALQETSPGGGETPEAVINDFFTDLNMALSDPAIQQPRARQIWAGRLSSYFAPSERVDQQEMIGVMLARFAAEQHYLPENQRLYLEIVYSNLEPVEHAEDRATFRLRDGRLQLRQVRIETNETETLLEREEQPLDAFMGEYSESLPVLQASGRWFLTNKPPRNP